MFVLLALFFAVGFVVFGVGGEVPGGVADIIGQGGTATGQPSVGDAREKLEENPNDTTALRELSTALQTDGRSGEAIAPLTKYTRLKPNDEDALRELAVLHVTKATRLRDEAQRAQIEAQELAPGTDLLSTASPLGQAVARRPVSEAITAGARERFNTKLTEMQAAYGAAKNVYQRLAKLVPRDAQVQLQLADAAANAGDNPAALAAYKRFLKLAPDDVNAPYVREQVKRLQSPNPLG